MVFVKDKNLIIVGGSCINSAAATVLGGAYCGAAFTEATNVGPGQFLIKAYDGAFTEGKIALVVAGYESADTVHAATYLRTQTVAFSRYFVKIFRYTPEGVLFPNASLLKFILRLQSNLTHYN